MEPELNRGGDPVCVLFARVHFMTVHFDCWGTLADLKGGREGAKREASNRTSASLLGLLPSSKLSVCTDLTFRAGLNVGQRLR